MIKGNTDIEDDYIEEVAKELEGSNEEDTPILMKIFQSIEVFFIPENHALFILKLFNNDNIFILRKFNNKVGFIVDIWKALLMYFMVTYIISKTILVEYLDYTVWEVLWEYYRIVRKTMKIGDYNEIPMIVQHLLATLSTKKSK